MKSQDYQSPTLDQEKPGDTPRGFMKLIKEGEADFTSFFTILCRYVSHLNIHNLGCVCLDLFCKFKRITSFSSEL